MANWQEKMSRGLAKMAMSNFTSVADALQELVDNPIDYKQGQPLSIQITHDQRRDLLIVESDGGRGMGEEEISVWLNWGEGEEPGPSDIRQYHQGGKAACGFLAGEVRLYAKKRGSEDIWLLEDENWASRSEPKDFGVPSPLSREK
ncbi:MAG: ATP-binding protein [Dehalococcoidia bacterium]|nr:ATP-binding protein [Dehalococcoidia bacterium]